MILWREMMQQGYKHSLLIQVKIYSGVYYHSWLLEYKPRTKHEYKVSYFSNNANLMINSTADRCLNTLLPSTLTTILLLLGRSFEHNSSFSNIDCSFCLNFTPKSTPYYALHVVCGYDTTASCPMIDTNLVPHPNCA